MSKILTLSLLALLTLGASMAQASLVVDPTAAALGSSSVFDPLDELSEVTTPTVRNTPSHWQGNRSSDVYLVRRDGERSAWLDLSEVPGSLKPYDPPSTLDLPKWRDGGTQLHIGPRIHDPDSDQWLGLDLRRGRPPVAIRPHGGGQPHTPTTPAPEPGTVMLLASGMGAVGAVGYARRRLAARG